MCTTYEPTKYVAEVSRLNTFDKYKELYKKSLENPENFWMELGGEIYWYKSPTPGKFMSYNFDKTKGNIFVKFLEGALTNVCYNVLDRHVKNGNASRIAYYL